jgi:glycerol-3-phosphate acyltransferase PlsY
MVVLPLIIGAMIGSDVGRKSTSAKSATKAGLLNGVYASLVYLIAIIVIYMVVSYLTMQYVSKEALVAQDIVVPIMVFIATLESFALLSFLKKVG